MPHCTAGQYDVEIDARDSNRRVITVRNENGDVVEPSDREWFVNQGRAEMLFHLPDDLGATEEEIDAITNYARNPPPPTKMRPIQKWLDEVVSTILLVRPAS